MLLLVLEFQYVAILLNLPFVVIQAKWFRAKDIKYDPTTLFRFIKPYKKHAIALMAFHGLMMIFYLLRVAWDVVMWITWSAPAATGALPFMNYVYGTGGGIFQM